MLTAILLAAGSSQRMGGANKLLLPFRDRTILETTLDQLQAAGPWEILVVAGYEADRLLPLLKNYRCRIINNPAYATGMGSSIRAGVAAAGPETSGYMICLADMPLIGADVYRLLMEAFEQRLETDPLAIVQPRYRGQRGHPVLFSAAHREALFHLEFPEGARPVVQANPEHLWPVELPTDTVLLDADTPAAYARLLARLQGA